MNNRGVFMNLILFPLKNYSTPNGYHISKDKLDEPWYSMHFHDSIEITLLAKGTCSQIINGTEYFMPTYTFVVMCRQDCHRFYDYSHDNLLYNLMIMPSLLPENVIKTLEDMTTDKICTLPEGVGKTVISLMDALNHLQNSDQSYAPNLISSLLQNIIDIFLHHYKTHPTSKTTLTENIIQSALLYINSNYTNNITLGDISKHANCNPTYLSEYFHKKMGVTLKQYITILRVKRAKKLLTSSNESIMTICYESGFSSLASFNRNFLELENLSPSAYRKSYNSKNQAPN